ncbi:MAG: helix-turn-helix transcriptional regulator [Alphaproteobacteria bacterium]|nr:helix-turn-helix transcriptional regulator [Alphaproteobacteria bacterium]
MTNATSPLKKRGRKPIIEGQNNLIDSHIGRRLRMRRTLMGLSQEKLGEAMGLSFQQVQKYERGTNRIGASRLYELAQILSVPVTFFYDGLANEQNNSKSDWYIGQDGARHVSPSSPMSMADTDQSKYDGRRVIKREILELARAFDRIEDEKLRKRILNLTRSLGDLFQPDAKKGKAFAALDENEL